ncbi:mannose-6-phosphate isomerase, class I [Microbacterium esteraromaticum]|uniref:mannose-6-phosphate isomerase, class I n=1 Tax=Microbacterium esteraromaticum TaxID=57043 RepID=UPI001A8EF3E1|nr:mannose-6-phosphate isomerase, class I [Microbacterium esteraromaticum]MBN8423794.1 mannose-6-phosphate isomerase, class I [Microbacterium esteraromaticum]
MLLTITNAPRDYAWGSTSLIASLEGRAPSGTPEAEVWFGDHPGDPSDVAGGGTLDEVTGGTLPYLLKLLAAAAPLSIQVHPTRAQAREGFAREAGMDAGDPTRNYRDDNHKPELIVALSDRFEALAGLRPLADTRRLLAVLPDAPGVIALRARLASDDDAVALRDAIAWVLSGDAQAEVDDIIAAVSQARSEEFSEPLAAVRSIAGRNPGDAGVVVALLMNFVVLRPGEAIFLRAGLLHAYVSGLGVEIMAASDNVLRGGLTPKHIDVDELLAIVDTTPGPVPVQAGTGSVTDYSVPVEDFALRRVQVDGAAAFDVTGPTMVLATSGLVSVESALGSTAPIAVGSAAFITADEGKITLRGHGEAFIARPGRV